MTADSALDRIIADLSDRSGLGDEWSQIDPDIKFEIMATWQTFISEESGYAVEHIEEQAASLRSLQAEVERWKIEADNLRQLIQCAECSAMLGDGDHYAWMPNMCPECLAEMYLPLRNHDDEPDR